MKAKDQTAKSVKDRPPAPISDAESASERYRAPALDKGLDIIELLARQPDGLTRAEIQRDMGRSPSEIYRMLERLIARGYVVRLASGDRYMLSLKLFVLANAHPPMRRLVQQALPLMDRFALETRQSLHLVMPDHGGAVVAAQSSPGTTWEFRVRVGARLDLLDTGSGITLLAFRDDESLSAIRALWNDSSCDARLHALGPELAQIRAQGHRIDASRQLVGVQDISVPVLSHTNEAIAVITCAYIAHPDGGADDGVTPCMRKLRALAAELAVG